MQPLEMSKQYFLILLNVHSLIYLTVLMRKRIPQTFLSLLILIYVSQNSRCSFKSEWSGESNVIKILIYK